MNSCCIYTISNSVYKHKYFFSYTDVSGRKHLAGGPLLPGAHFLQLEKERNQQGEHKQVTE